ncbi:MAG: beta-ketoacyl-ACP synthase II [Candidatus Aminicenantes bacterium]|nr:beta-ketoacyl-ACP synthase II [Candidatus Aminicenantes bacterium]MDH5466612.1 beta-ketoacyl-ACP synthase II [Candidatus Aminicenantes bacterium]MDH5704904.1 beta-ketoacyl-ACP synthase II [Candidatus Aminicenantes bacterium]
MNRKKRDTDTTRVVITGMGTINPIGYNVEEFWENLIAGKSGIRLIQNVDLSDFSVKIGGEVDYPDLSEYFPKRMLSRLGRFIIFGHVAATQAVKDAGFSLEDLQKEPSRHGVIIGTGDAGNGLHYEMFRQIQDYGMDSVSPFYAVGAIPNTPPAYFAKEHNFQGPNFSVNSACATSNHAIGVAALMIKTGLADVMITGGTESVLNAAGFSGFGIINALSRRNDSPQTASRPFDKDRDGFVMGEGSGILCLEELEHARKRGARIHAELRGFGFSCDAYDLVAPHPDGIGAKIAMENALITANLNKEDIDLINAHATSTPLGDLMESRAIRSFFGGLADNIPVHSTKSMIGHLIGGAGGAEAIAVVLAIQKGVIHPSINVFERDPRIDLNIVANKPMEKKVQHVLSNSFGFGGQNAAIIISKFDG